MANLEEQSLPSTTGVVLHGTARYYDFMTWLMTLGREKAFRERLLDLAGVKSGESVLDVGCGTGRLAIVAKRRVGPTGNVSGVDASPEMIDRAKRNARKARIDVAFRVGVVETLAFPDGHFDAVLSTLMLHHLPPKAREQCAGEMRRVVKPGGRVFAMDFGGSDPGRKGLLSRFHRRHGSVPLPAVVSLLTSSGLTIVQSGAVGLRDLHFVLATAPESA